MNAIASILAVTLLVQEAAPASPCKVTDNACNARDFERRADQTADPTTRAWRLHSAHRSYLFLFDQTGNVEHLCAARRAYERSLAVKDLPARERAGLMARLADLETRERQHKPRCSKNASRPRRDPPLLTSASRESPAGVVTEAPPSSPAEVSPSTVAALADAEPRADPVAAPATPNVGAPPSVVSAPTSVGASPAVVSAPAHPEPRIGPLTSVRRPQPVVRSDGRSLVIAGSVSLLAGLTLTVAAGVTGGRALATSRELWALHNTANGTANADQLAQDAALRDQYRRQLSPALALALTSGGLLVIGAVLTGIGGQRITRSRLALSPAPAGFALHARF